MIIQAKNDQSNELSNQHIILIDLPTLIKTMHTFWFCYISLQNHQSLSCCLVATTASYAPGKILAAKTRLQNKNPKPFSQQRVVLDNVWCLLPALLAQDISPIRVKKGQCVFFRCAPKITPLDTRELPKYGIWSCWPQNRTYCSIGPWTLVGVFYLPCFAPDNQRC